MILNKQEAAAPPDPRLAVPGYKTGIFPALRLREPVKVWKQERLHAPHILAPYVWDPAISIGSGPPVSVVVTGYDPITTHDAQLRAVFRTFGEIALLERKMDSSTGAYLSLCSIKFKEPAKPGLSTPAIEAARSAEKEGSGQRIGVYKIRVERDRTGKKCKHLEERMTLRNKERRAQADPQKLTLKTAKPSQHDVVLAPPPNAPKGPSGKPIVKPASLPVKPPEPVIQSVVHQNHHLLEQENVIGTIKRKPYIFIACIHVPVMATTVRHLKNRLRSYEWQDVRCDETGYYVIFDDSRQGEEEAVRCYEGSNGHPLFTYEMNMECQRYGNPKYERSPSPQRLLANKREKQEREMMERDEKAIIEEERRQRADNADPVIVAVEQLRNELRDKIMSDIKTRIAAPALYEHLDPERQATKRRRLGVPDPQTVQQSPSYLPIGEAPLSSRIANHKVGPAGIFKKNINRGSLSISRLRQEPPTSKTNVSAFADERRQKPVKRKVEVRPLHHQLQDFYGAGDSDDEDKPSREDTKEQDSRPLSRMSSATPQTETSDEPSSKRRRLIHKEAFVAADESGDESYGIARSLLDPHLMKKEPEDMALAELNQIIGTLPINSALFRRAKDELSIRKQDKADDQLFRPKQEDLDLDDAFGDGVVLSKELNAFDKTKGKGKNKKKSKKQIFEERESAKADLLSARKLLKTQDHPTPEPTDIEEAEIEKIEEAEEEERAEVEWGVSTEQPRRTVEDDHDLLLDTDGWQYLLKDDEDLKFLKEAVTDEAIAGMKDVHLWVYKQKAIKALNSGNMLGHSLQPPRIKGYYVSNSTGSARTEGVKKILEVEKSKYLPHRIKVAQARELREAEAKNPAALLAEAAEVARAAEAVRKEKLASNATSRSNRASQRTQAKDLNTTKQVLAADGQHADMIRFNQLMKRKKLVKFDRSAIHGWGLYAEENIAVSDMIIEYVGEKLRQAVANIREMRYDKQGMGSSYLFRIDEDTVVDATKKGGIARFINHSCLPNCTAKIIRVDGTKRIVIYALKEIAKSKSFRIRRIENDANNLIQTKN